MDDIYEFARGLAQQDYIVAVTMEGDELIVNWVPERKSDRKYTRDESADIRVEFIVGFTRAVANQRCQ